MRGFHMPHLALILLVLQCHMSSAALSNVVCCWASIWLCLVMQWIIWIQFNVFLHFCPIRIECYTCFVLCTPVAENYYMSCTVLLLNLHCLLFLLHLVCLLSLHLTSFSYLYRQSNEMSVIISMSFHNHSLQFLASSFSCLFKVFCNLAEPFCFWFSLP